MSDIYPDITIEEFYSFAATQADLSTVGIDEFKAFRMLLTDAEGGAGPSFGLYRSVLFEAEIASLGGIFHLCEGTWYRAEPDFIKGLRYYVDSKCEPSDLIPYNHDAQKNGHQVYSEEAYNAAVPKADTAILVLDQTSITPAGNTAVEPCDLYRATADASTRSGQLGIFYHVKISTRSAMLSHLFNQGINSVELLELSPEALARLKGLLKARIGPNNLVDYTKPLSTFDFKVVFAIVTHKKAADKSQNLPLFSLMALARAMQALDLMKLSSGLMFVPDQSPAKGGHSKHAKVVVEVVAVGTGTEIRPLPGQGYDTAKQVKGCPKAIREALAGKRYRVSIKVDAGGDLSTYHGWPVEEVAP